MDSDVGECWDSPPMTIERKGKKTVSLAQRAYLYSLFEASMRSASENQRPQPHLEKVAADILALLAITVITNSCKSVSFCHVNV